MFIFNKHIVSTYYILGTVNMNDLTSVYLESPFCSQVWHQGYPPPHTLITTICIWLLCLISNYQMQLNLY